MNSKVITLPSAMILAASILVSCGTQKPVLYPNSHLKSVGQEQADRDLRECEQLASDHVSSDAGKETAKSTGIGAAGGAIIGGAIGAVTGDFGRSVAAGAAGGGAGGLLSGLFRASEPSPVHKAFVERCLREKGYEPIGWK